MLGYSKAAVCGVLLGFRQSGHRFVDGAQHQGDAQLRNPNLPDLPA
jgi:hypothetical protein